MVKMMKMIKAFMMIFKDEFEDMQFRYKLSQRIPRWKIIFAPLCWIRRKHAWTGTLGLLKDGGAVDTARCKVCAVFYHEWW